MKRSCPPQLLRLLTLLTLLLSDASVFGVAFTSYIHLMLIAEQHHQDSFLPLLTLITTGTGVIMYGVAALWSAYSAATAARYCLREVQRGRVPGLTINDCVSFLQGKDCVSFLQGKPVFDRTLPQEQRSSPRRFSGVEDCIARDPERALSVLCARRGPLALAAYQRLVTRHALRSCRLRHSVPFYRLMFFGWQPSVEPYDFAGVLRASLIWGALVGMPTSGLSIAFTVATGEDALRQQLLGSCIVGAASFLLSGLQVVTGFPAALLRLHQQEMAWLEGVVRAEFKAAEDERKQEQKLGKNVEAKLREYNGSARAALRDVKWLELDHLYDKLRYVRSLAENPELMA